MTYYIAGKITDKTPDKEAKNKLRFYNKEAELESLGISVYNPARYETPGQSWNYYLAQDLEVIFSKKITGAYFMTGWKDSEGARLEYQACLRKQIQNPKFQIIEEQ